MIVRKNRVGVRSLALGVFTFLIIVFLLFIPVLLGKHNAMAILNDDKYHDSIFDYNIQTLVKSSIRNIGFLVYNFALFLILIPIGFRRTGYKVYFVVLLIPFLFFILKHNVSDSYVFHLVPYLIFTIWFGRALDCISFKIKPVYIFLLPVFYFATYNIVNFTSIGENINKETGFKGGT
ncbi:MAG: hypothetical protein Q4G16_11900, partial [Cruoricaptor ignavus]|nr:hypothetical protein [Cruoricaptor ignavus]